MADSIWSRTWTLFYRALELAPEDRAAFLERECGSDVALKREVEELLANVAPSGVLDQSPAAIATALSPQPLEGTRVGNYLIRARIGAGGMGVVYDAEQASPVQRQVALKVIHPGTHRDAAARFAVERQALARMNHPHIARVFDAGALDDGRPFIAMEYVAGVPFNEYCDREGLNVAARLALFVQVCHAIQHAHQKGIIHRDIKPSNVLVSLVDGVATPKVIDFGVAKAMQPLAEDEEHRTIHGSLIGTIEYMSPEQLDPAGLDTDTRSDIYSLGVMLYESLAGVLPFDWPSLRKAGLEGLRRVAKESEPPRPSRRVRELEAAPAQAIAARRRTTPAALARRLDGDLDWILLKALDRERTRRYASASELADDIRRHLATEPVLAGPPAATYRVRKFVRRHRAAVAMAAGILLIVSVAAVLMIQQSIEIRRSAQIADRERQRAERVSEVMVNIFRASDPFQGRGTEVTAREVLDRSSQRIATELTDDPQVKASVLHAIALSYRQLRVFDRAETMAREAIAIRRSVHAGDHLEIAESLKMLGRILVDRAKVPDGAAALEEAVAVERRLLAAGDPRRAEGLTFLASAKRNQGQFDAAIAALDEALRLRATPAAAAPIHEEYGNVEFRRGDLDAAEKQYRAALELRRGFATEPQLAESATRIAVVANERGDYPGSEVMLKEALLLLEKHLGPDHEGLAVPLGSLALALHFQSKYDEAAAIYDRALAIWRKRQGDSHPGVTSSLNNLGLLAHDRGRFAEAERIFRQSLELQRVYTKKEHPEIALALNNIARVLHDQGRRGEAEEMYRQSLAMRRKLLPPTHPQLAESLLWYGKFRTEKHELADAEAMLREGVAIRAKARADDWRLAEARSLLGGNLVAQKRFEEAEPLLVDGYTMMEQKRGPGYRRTLQALERVVALYDAWQKPEEAARHRAALKQHRAAAQAVTDSRSR